LLCWVRVHFSIYRVFTSYHLYHTWFHPFHPSIYLLIMFNTKLKSPNFLPQLNKKKLKFKFHHFKKCLICSCK
jgi:hypothetical protein